MCLTISWSKQSLTYTCSRVGYRVLVDPVYWVGDYFNDLRADKCKSILNSNGCDSVSGLPKTPDNIVFIYTSRYSTYSHIPYRSFYEVPAKKQ